MNFNIVSKSRIFFFFFFGGGGGGGGVEEGGGAGWRGGLSDYNKYSKSE